MLPPEREMFSILELLGYFHPCETIFLTLQRKMGKPFFLVKCFLRNQTLSKGEMKYHLVTTIPEPRKLINYYENLSQQTFYMSLFVIHNLLNFFGNLRP